MRTEDEEKNKDKSDPPMGRFQRISTILPNMLFTDSLSKPVVFEESLELPSNKSTLEEVLTNAGKVTQYNNTGEGSQYVNTYAVEIEKLLKEMGISSEYLVTLSQNLKIDSETVYWQINYSSIEGYGKP